MLVIQDPTNAQSTYLLESLLDAFQAAEKVASAFSFVSSAGVRLLTEDNLFKDVAFKHTVDLVVGIDAVTNNCALDSLAAVAKEYPNVRARAFLNPSPGTLFHPKFCWTKHENGGCLITGSGNLTESGLLGNWEAYSVEQLDLAGISAVESAWDSWTTLHSQSLLPLDNADVRRLASANSVLARTGDLPTLVARTTPPTNPGEESVEPQLMPNSAVSLVAEIPKSGNRWSQANFHYDDYVNFFGARDGAARLLVFRHVKPDGTMDDYERNRPPVTVRSRNFRFELAAALGIPYPDPKRGRPIGVFVRVATRTFFYRLMLPNDPEYAVVSALLDHHKGPPQDRMRSVRMTVANLRTEWPNSPFWRLPAMP